MNVHAAALMDERSTFLEPSLVSLFQPIAEDLTQSQELYRETILATSERNYFHSLLYGTDFSYIPDEFRVPVADRIAHHLLQSDGKWIRAALVLFTAHACGKRGSEVHQVAVAVELIHLATLVHDDIIDEAPMRRGVQSIPGGWGNSVAVLLGDFLFSKAFKLLLTSRSIPSQMRLTRATGQMCLGEIKQLFNTYQHKTSETEYLEMIENKTASLMAAAAASGAHLGETGDALVEWFHEYGYALGMAFQITDDVLDYTSSTGVMGKEQGVDLRNGKITLPMIHLFQNRPSVTRILETGETTEVKTSKLLEIMKEIGSIDYAYSIGQRYGNMAKQALNKLEKELGRSDSLYSLNNLIDFILNRDR